MAVNKLDPKIIFASEAPAQDTPAVFNNRTLGWGESRKNGGRPTIKQMNALQQDTELKILWLNENSVTPFDATIDYPVNAVTIKDGQFKIFNGTSWDLFLDKSSVGLNNVDNTSDLNKPISTAVKTKLNYIDNNGAALPYNIGIVYEENAVVVKDGVLQQWKGGGWVIISKTNHNEFAGRDAAEAHPASSISDVSGETQQKINDGIASLDELRLIDPKTKGRRIYLNSVIADKNLGAGTFVSTNKSNLADNGGTIVSSANPNLMWVRVEYDVMTPEMFGCIGDGVTDDTDAMIKFGLAKYNHKVAANDYALTATPTFNIEHDSTIIDFSKSKIIGTNFAYTALRVEVNKSIKSLNIKAGSYNGGGVVNGYLEVPSTQPAGYADIINIECFGNLENFSNEKNTRSTFGIYCAVPARIVKVLNPVVSNVHNKNGTVSVSSASGVAVSNYQMLGIIENPVINGVYTSTGADADGLVLFEQKDVATTGTGVGVVKNANLTQCCGRGIKSQSNLAILGADITLSATQVGTVINSWRGIDAQLGGMYCKDINYNLKGATLFNVDSDAVLFQSSGSTISPQDQIVKNVTVKGSSNTRHFMLLTSNNHKNVVIDQIRLLDPQPNLNCLYVTAGVSVTGSVSFSNMSSGWWSNGRLFFDDLYTGSNIPKLNISNVDWDGYNMMSVSKFNKIRIIATPSLGIQGLLSYDAISKDSSFYYGTDGSDGGITYTKPTVPSWAKRYCHYDKGVVYSTLRNEVLTFFGGKFYQSLGTVPTEIV